MKTYMTVILIVFSILWMPLISFAALDWHIRWDGDFSPQIAKIYIFNPEDTNQTFSIEIGDVAKLTEPDPYAPYLIVGQDKKITLAPSERRIFDIIVYRDVDPESVLAQEADSRSLQLSYERHRQAVQILGEKYGESQSREYPYIAQGISIVPKEREELTGTRYTYRSGRGYWRIALADHDHILEQLIRTGDRMGALHDSIQQAIFYYTQGYVQLTGEALKVWETAFPELRAFPTPTPTPGDCMYLVTVVTVNLSYYSSSRTITVGDILASSDPKLARVVAAEDLAYTVAPNSQSSKRSLRVYLMSKAGQPSPQSEYVSIVSHDSQIERVIRVGTAERYHPCAIQDVIHYINRQVPSLTIGAGLWERLEGSLPDITPTPSPGRYSLCLGNPTVSPGNQPSLYGSAQMAPVPQTVSMTFKNLIVLVGAIVPVGVLFRRKPRK